jgi:arginase
MCKLGQTKNGVQYGGNYILQSNKNLPINTIKFNSNIDYLRTYHLIKQNIRKFNFNIGGDHSISASTIQPLIDYYDKDLLVVWIDAHPDINTFTTSQTKNFHGMPVSALLGLMPHYYQINNTKKLLPSNLLYCGLRSIDNDEKTIMHHHRLYNNCDIIELIYNHPASKIHISFDVDAINPKLIPSTGTPVDGGLYVEDILEIIDVSRRRLVSFDLVEFNPYIGTQSDVKKSVNNINKIIDHVKQSKLF